MVWLHLKVMLKKCSLCLSCFYVIFHCIFLACSLVQCRLFNLYLLLETKMLIAWGSCSIWKGLICWNCITSTWLERLWEMGTCDTVYTIKLHFKGISWKIDNGIECGFFFSLHIFTILKVVKWQENSIKLYCGRTEWLRSREVLCFTPQRANVEIKSKWSVSVNTEIVYWMLFFPVPISSVKICTGNSVFIWNKRIVLCCVLQPALH